MPQTKPTPEAERSREFPSTHWSSIARVVQESKGGKREELSNFVRRYLPVLRTYLVFGRGLTTDSSEECLQGFVADKIVEKEILARADPLRGRLRNFLLTSLNNYLASALKREKLLRLRHQRSAATKEDAVEHDPTNSFNRAWAQSIVADAVSRMERECASKGRLDVWRVFEQRIYVPARDGTPPASYELLIKQLGLSNPVAASNLLITAKRAFARCLRESVSEYAVDAMEVEREIAELRTALGEGVSQGG